jgi:hypothetical protein
MEPEGSLQYSQEHATGLYPEPDAPSPYLPTLLPLRSILILSHHLRLLLPTDLFRLGFPTKFLYAFLISPMRATFYLHMTLVSSENNGTHED